MRDEEGGGQNASARALQGVFSALLIRPRPILAQTLLDDFQQWSGKLGVYHPLLLAR